MKKKVVYWDDMMMIVFCLGIAYLFLWGLNKSYHKVWSDGVVVGQQSVYDTVCGTECWEIDTELGCPVEWVYAVVEEGQVIYKCGGWKFQEWAGLHLDGDIVHG